MKRLAIVWAGVAIVLTVPNAAYAVNTRLLYRVPNREHGKVAIDTSGHHHNGRLIGGISRRDGAYKFHKFSQNHHYDRIIIPNDPVFNPGFQKFTYRVRLKVAPNAVWSHRQMAVLRHGDSDAPGGDYKMELQKSTVTGRVSAFCVMHDDDGEGNGFVEGRGGLTSIADGAWHNIACSRVAQQKVALTIDGRSVVRRTHGNLGRVRGNVPIMIGCQLQADKVHFREQFNGLLDDISISTP